MNKSLTISVSSPKPSYDNAPCDPFLTSSNDGLSPIAHSTPSQKSTADSPDSDSSLNSTASLKEEYSEPLQSINNKKPSTASKNLMDQFDIAALVGRQSTPPDDISLWDFSANSISIRSSSTNNSPPPSPKKSNIIESDIIESDIIDANTNDDKNSTLPSPKKRNIIESDIKDDNTKGSKKSTMLANFLYYSGAVAIIALSVLALVYLPSLLNLKMPRLSSNILFKGTSALASSPAPTHGLKQFVTKTSQL